jgi:hypothetical protein
MCHPDFVVLTVSWELALRADGYADNTVKAYRKAVQSLADWLAEHQMEVGVASVWAQSRAGSKGAAAAGELPAPAALGPVAPRPGARLPGPVTASTRALTT